MLGFVFPLLADSNVNNKVQVFVLRKDTADTIHLDPDLLVVCASSRSKVPLVL